jgi:putative 4-mercaptohistidine N1-methyltranferase
VPIDSFESKGFYDVIGNVWQWCSTPIYPFEGFRVHKLYDDFTMPTFDGKHNLIKGGSFASCGNETLYSSRYAFRRHFFQHAGFRYVQSSYNEQISSSAYEVDNAISRYCEFDWQENDFYTNVIAFAKPYIGKNVLNLGALIGRGAYELSKLASRIIAIDATARFIALAQMLKEQKSVRYGIQNEGELLEYKAIKVEDFGENVEFWQGDSSNLKPHWRDFDTLFAPLLLDRLEYPKRFLEDAHTRLKLGGYLILGSTYAYTGSDLQGSIKKDGEDRYALEEIEATLTHFKRIATKDIDYTLKESARKRTLYTSELSIWQRIH